MVSDGVDVIARRSTTEWRNRKCVVKMMENMKNCKKYNCSKQQCDARIMRAALVAMCVYCVRERILMRCILLQCWFDGSFGATLRYADSC